MKSPAGDTAESQRRQGAPTDPRVIRRSMVISIVAGGLGQVFFNIIMGGVFAQYVRKIGLEHDYPVLLSLIPLTGLIQIFSTHLMERLASRRLFFFATHGPVRLLWLVIGSLPLWTTDPGVLFYALAGLLILQGLLQSTGLVAWLSWMADLVPTEARGRYFGYRQMFASMLGALGGAVAGIYLTSHGDNLDAFRWVFYVASAFGVADIVLFAFVHHPKHEVELDRPTLLEMLRRCWRNEAFRRLLSAMAPWHFGNGVMWGFILLYMLGPLRMSTQHAQYIAATGMVFLVLTSSLFGMFADRYGHKTTLVLCMMIHFTLPAMYLFATPSFPHPVWLGWVLGMSLGQGIFTSHNNVLMAHSAKGHLSMSFAIFGLMTGTIMCVALLLAKFSIGDVNDAARWSILGWSLHPYQVVIASGSIFRVAAFLLALRVPSEDKKPESGVVIRQMFSTGPFKPFASLYRYLRVSVSDTIGNGDYARRHPSARWQVASGDDPISDPIQAERERNLSRSSEKCD